ncbi:hypothetical protein EZV62_010692 [Acer yangbiense]|uniref:V-SNARE coiled-coil homology domain-containing protein n=1 Tax=Acer yangbiense TaxID=1000413 RepID=A0A5C7I3W8_9ROSI|nr:hypothetical protein EZV62_010692 [Acer yangbiense]
MWRSSREWLPTLVNLARRKVPVNGLCPVCSSSFESTVHALWACHRLKIVRNRYGLLKGFHFGNFASFQDFVFYCFHNLDKKDFEFLCVVLWRVWFLRNQLVHVGGRHDVENVVSWADFVEANSVAAHQGVPYCVVAVESVGRQVPIAFLERIKEEKLQQQPKLKEQMQYCVDHPEEVSKLAKVKAQVSVENIKKVLDRGEKIELLVDKTENLRSQGTKFRRKMWMQIAEHEDKTDSSGNHNFTDSHHSIIGLRWRQMLMNALIGVDCLKFDHAYNFVCS